MISKSDLPDFDPKSVNHIRVAQFKMTWLILDTESCAVIGRIDVTSDVHVEVSCTKLTVVTSS
jgi:hypothetical protein